MGSLVGMQVCLWILGTEFKGLRQLVGAHVLFLIAVIFIRSVGNADGGPPNFNDAWVDLISVPVAGVIQWLARNRQSKKPI